MLHIEDGAKFLIKQAQDGYLKPFVLNYFKTTYIE